MIAQKGELGIHKNNVGKYGTPMNGLLNKKPWI